MPAPPEIPQFTDARSSHPLPIRALNRIGSWLSTGRALAPDDVWSAARTGGLEDLEPTPEASEALARLLDSLASNVRLTFVGRFSARDDTVRLARTHLRLHRALGELPAESRGLSDPPVFIVGWPRTGTTFLHQLLACDPDHRTIPYWESFDPVPPPVGEPDRRIAKLDEMLALLARIEPRYDAIHPMTAESPEECVALFMNEFRSLQLDFQYHVPGYVDWLMREDARLAYRLHARQLALIHFHRPMGMRWLLKDPTHLIHLDALLDVHPDARIILTHRDPVVALSSICSLIAYTRALFTDEVDPHAIGTEVFSGYWPEALERSLKTRDRLAADRVVDVRHPDLVRDPMSTVESIYTTLGLAWDGTAGAAMRAFIEERERERRGRHVHSLGGFGLRAEEVRERFAAYCDAFDL